MRDSLHAKICSLMLHDLVWAQGQTSLGRGWLVSRTTTLLCHLRECAHQPDSVRSRAQSEAPASPGRPRPVMNHPSSHSQIPPEASGSRLMAHPPYQLAPTLSAPPQSHSTYSPSTSGSFPSSQADSPAFSDLTQSSRPSKRARRTLSGI